MDGNERRQDLIRRGSAPVIRQLWAALSSRADRLETQKLEQLEARMDEIADRVARDRTNAARERTSTHEAQRPSH
jgi:hypothetical protein